jgi:hypothetical protein
VPPPERDLDALPLGQHHTMPPKIGSVSPVAGVNSVSLECFSLGAGRYPGEWGPSAPRPQPHPYPGDCSRCKPPPKRITVPPPGEHSDYGFRCVSALHAAPASSIIPQQIGV